MAAERRFAKRREEWRRNRADERLFRHLAEIHELGAPEIDLLTALADRHGLVRLSEVFLRPSLLTQNPDPARFRDTEVEHLYHRIMGPAGPKKSDPE